MCARSFEAKDGRRKYCDDCRKARKKMFDYNAVRKARDAARQRRKDIEQQNADLIRENYDLREKVHELENRNRILCARLAVFLSVKKEGCER
jgi:glutaredoxin